MYKIFFVTNIPAPYREKIHEIVSRENDLDYTVLYCQLIEKNRSWKLEHGNYKKIFLNSKKITIGIKTYYIGLGITKYLLKERPDVVITGGLNLPMILAFLYTKVFRKKHIAYTDAWPGSEENLKLHHKLLRKLVYPNSQAFIGVSDKSFTLFQQYTSKALDSNKCYYSYLCADNDAFYSDDKKKYDLLYCGQFIEGKLPFFMCDVVKEVKKTLPNINILLIGNGVLHDQTIKVIIDSKIEYHSPGFVQPSQLPHYFSKCKILLFPTKRDAWGLVANEACASGVPVITTPYAGVKGELVIDGINGYILEPNVKEWSEKIIELLTNDEKYNSFSKKARSSSLKYNYHDAADGIVNAIRSVL